MDNILLKVKDIHSLSPISTPCYRHFPEHLLLRTIKDELFATQDKTKNEFPGTDKLRDILDDFLGGKHRFHNDSPLPDRWNNLNARIKLIEFLLTGFPSLSEEMVDLLFGYLVYNFPDSASITDYSTELYTYFLKAKHISPFTLVRMISWLSTIYSLPRHNYLLTRRKVPLNLIFEHPSFPKNSLTKYCYSPIPQIRIAASQSPNCPPEGRIAVALIKGSVS